MRRAGVAVLLLLAIGGCRNAPEAIRIGAQEVLGAGPAFLGFARDDFQGSMNVPVRPVGFISAPAALDALLTDKVDIAYVDTVCAVNAYVRSKGKFVIIAGVSAGAGALVASSGTVTVDELRTANVGTPQQGDLEDVTARQFFSERGFISREQGGEFQINPAANLDLLPLLLRQSITAAWTTEPWVSALVEEANGHILLRDDDVWQSAGGGTDVSMVVVASRSLVTHHPEIIDGFLTAHLALVDALRAGGADDRRACTEEFSRFVGRAFSESTMASAWSRVRFSPDVPRDAVTRHAYAAFRVGFLGRDVPDLKTAIVDEPLSRAVAAVPSR